MPLQDVGNSFKFKPSRPVTYVVTATLAIALYNTIELTFLLFLTFKRHKGLYFWSFLVATWGISIYAIGFILKDFVLANSYLSVTLIIIGWCAMVTGQSMVLYSRLHLIVQQRNTFRLVLGMIIVNAIILHIPVIILCYGANSTHFRDYVLPYAIYEKIQVTLFFIQESIISGIYVYETCKMLRAGAGMFLDELHQEATRRLMLHLIYVIIIVALLDISILALEYAGRFTAQTAVKALVYSVKLKLEFDILNRLADLVQRPDEVLFVSESGRNYPDGTSHQTRGVVVHHRRCGFWGVWVDRVTHTIARSVSKGFIRPARTTHKEVVTISEQNRVSTTVATERVVQIAHHPLADGRQDSLAGSMVDRSDGGSIV
ncbi:hypothetical protein NUU61_007177 [Penicillium alfredii]|uniref:DUF7703 domain-containing protein n=1 Tax=Penicillium alfredii TaxID=1506179 RepID=A0A9W9F2B1_9EURO|nr:uncharacterized protein NUU61_007177 [Penicillium alfredii]KAJ5092307.1 hypothetical protein NUU61_007177 [Penicillium alfredii]